MASCPLSNGSCIQIPTVLRNNFFAVWTLRPFFKARAITCQPSTTLGTATALLSFGSSSLSFTRWALTSMTTSSASGTSVDLAEMRNSGKERSWQLKVFFFVYSPTTDSLFYLVGNMHSTWVNIIEVALVKWEIYRRFSIRSHVDLRVGLRQLMRDVIYLIIVF